MENEKVHIHKSEAYIEAQKKVASLRSFYKHVAIYIFVNLFISFREHFHNMEAGATIKSSLKDGDLYTLWIIWGFVLLIHGMNVFSSINIFGAQWEKRKIKQYMDEETRSENL
ncbi:2TM domain-containing protein [uncultured Kordia sp.]|uniref:2TM domain-containing protein n=1 Tax=uncultured Kordia sp. TaxID=507699 RepID=UPI00260E3679|nr:2TM domain-containing protein [uncultured Kordia sp.]